MLKPVRFHSDIKSGPLPTWVVATGAEEFLRSELRQSIQERIGPDADLIELDADTELAAEEGLLRLFDELRTGSLFSPAKLIVIRKAGKLLKEAADAFSRFVDSEMPQAIVFLEDDEIVAKKAKKKTKPVASLEAAGAVFVDCATLYASPFGFGKPVWDSDLSRWVVERARALGKKLSLELAFQLHSRDSAGLRSIAAQLEKLALVTGDRVEISAEDIEAFVGGEKEATVFEIVDSFGAREGAKTLAATARLYRQGLKNANGAKSLDPNEISMRLLSLIATRLHELGRMHELKREGLSVDEALAKVVGAGRRWLFPKLKEQLQARSPRELGAAVVDMERLDRDLKTGAGAARDLMTLFLLKHGRSAQRLQRSAPNPYTSTGR